MTNQLTTMNFQSKFDNYINLRHLLTESNKFLNDKFHEIWSKLYGSKWIDGKNSGDYFLCNKIGKKILDSMNSIQKSQAKAGNSSQWDISFYYIMFSNLTYEKKNFILEHVDKIKQVRNEMSHLTDLNISKEDYENKWNRLAKSMILLGYGKEKLNKFKFELSTRNLETNEKCKGVEKMAKEGDKFLVEKNFKKSIDCYTKCLNSKVLNDKQRAELCCKRSLARLKLYQVLRKKDKDVLFKALVDAEQANTLDPRCHLTYTRLGQVYQQLNELKRSIENYEKSLVLNPGDEDVKNWLADAKRKDFDQTRQAHFDESIQPMTTEEHLESTIEKERDRFGGIQLNNKSVKKIKNIAISNIKGFNDVLKAHEFRDGSKNCEQSYQKAAMHYEKAVKVGNAEAMFNLALLYIKGEGVKVDYSKAIDLLNQAASQPVKTQIGKIQIPTVGVAEAEHSLGISYEIGRYVEKSYTTAIYWYQRAVNHEYGPSANNLALMYANGFGVEKDLDRAEKLFLYSQKRNCDDAISNLVDLYLSKRDTDNALRWHKIAVKKGSLYDRNRHDAIMEAVEGLQKLKEEPIIPSFPLESQYLRDTNNNTTAIIVPKKFFDISMLADYLLNGSKTAEKIIKAMIIFGKALKDFERIERNLENIFFEMATGYQICALVCKVPLQLVPVLIKQLEKILEKNIVNDFDLNARICYIYLTMGDVNGTIKFIDQSLEKYPCKYFLYGVRGQLKALIEMFNESIEDFNVVLEHEPNNIEIIFFKSLSLVGSNKLRESIELTKKYLELSPIDDFKVPDAYYSIGVCELSLLNDLNGPKVKQIIDKYLKLGLDAEKKQLPCFLPFHSSLRDNLLRFNFVFSFVTINRPVKDEYRIQVIKRHRSLYKQIIESKTKYKQCQKIETSNKPPRTQKMAHNLCGLEAITLNQIDFNRDHILTGYLLNLTIIEPPYFMTAVHFVVEDENKNVERMSVYNLGNDYEQIKQDFKIGTKFSIINPYVRMASDMYPIIRVDDPRSIVFSGQCVNKMCRYCGKDDSIFNCSKCNDAVYCSRECQIKDLKELDHKSICL